MMQQETTFKTNIKQKEEEEGLKHQQQNLQQQQIENEQHKQQILQQDFSKNNNTLSSSELKLKKRILTKYSKEQLLSHPQQSSTTIITQTNTKPNIKEEEEERPILLEDKENVIPTCKECPPPTPSKSVKRKIMSPLQNLNLVKEEKNESDLASVSKKITFKVKTKSTNSDLSASSTISELTSPERKLSERIALQKKKDVTKYPGGVQNALKFVF
ncbi:hypothetical protein ABK040_013156 [Willaertia magna]